MESAAQIHRWVGRLMGNRFEISVVSTEPDWATVRLADAVAEIGRIERLLTTFDEASQTAQINANAGIRPVRVDAEVFCAHRAVVAAHQLPERCAG